MKKIILVLSIFGSMNSVFADPTIGQKLCIEAALKAGHSNAEQYCSGIANEGQGLCVAAAIETKAGDGAFQACESIDNRGKGLCSAAAIRAGFHNSGQMCDFIVNDGQGICSAAFLEKRHNYAAQYCNNVRSEKQGLCIANAVKNDQDAQSCWPALPKY